MKKRVFYVVLMLLSFLTLNNSVMASTTFNVESAEEFYNAIEEIHNSSNESFIISLSNDIEIDSAVVEKNSTTIDNGNTVTLLGNGYTYKISNGEKGRLNVSNATLYLGLEDGSDELTIQGAGDGVPTYKSLVTISNGTVTMYDGVTLKDNKSGNTSLSGAAVRLNDNGNFIMNGGLITNNSSEASSAGGGAIFLDGTNSSFTMNDGEISNNFADSWGGAVLSYLEGTITINGGTFRNNEASYGGAIATIDRPVTIDNATFEGNKATYGGALLSYDYYGGTTMEVSNSEFRNNEASYGGAILGWGESLTVEDSIVTMNEASSYGGGVYLAAGDNDLSTTSVYNNKADSAGNDYFIETGILSASIIDADEMSGYASYDNINTNLLYWYNDDSSNRYDFNDPTNIVDPDSITPGTEYALTVAGDRIYIIKYESNGGTEIDDELLEVGEKVTRPTDPVKDGYSFINWYTDEELTTEYDFDDDVSDDLTLYAKWLSLEYEFISGANQKHKKSSTDDAIFEINADSSLLDNGKLYVDNTLITEDDYTLNNSIINLKSSFLKTLSTGEHSLKVELNNGGSAETKFSIIEEESKDDSKEDGINPATGDNIFNYLYLFAISTVLLMIINMNPYKTKYIRR